MSNCATIVWFPEKWKETWFNDSQAHGNLYNLIFIGQCDGQ